MYVEFDNGYSVIYGVDRETTSKLQHLTSYKVKNCHFVPSYKAGHWDGYIRLLRRTKAGGLRFPSGFFSDVQGLIAKLGLPKLEIVDQRRPVGEAIRLPWLAKDIELRNYQFVASQIGFDIGRGILKLPIRSGKTVIAADLIKSFGLKTVFVVTSQLIMAQTKKLFESVFGKEFVGQFGVGVHEPGFITIASIQSLQRMNDVAVKLMKEADVLIVDEVHHLKGDKWRQPILKADARYKFGLSSTVNLDKKQCEQSAIWLKAATGSILIDVLMQQLVEEGYILAPNILIAKADCNDRGTWQKVYNKSIVRNSARNETIAKAAKILVKNGHKVLIDTGRLEHIRNIFKRTTDLGLESAIIFGDIKASQRKSILTDFTSGKKPILIGTVMGEGVDVPELSAVINAEGGAAFTSTIQRMRNLTTHPGKKKPILVDFWDGGNRYLEKHSGERLKHYKAEPVFKVIGPLDVRDFLFTLQEISGK